MYNVGNELVSGIFLLNKNQTLRKRICWGILFIICLLSTIGLIFLIIFNNPLNKTETEKWFTIALVLTIGVYPILKGFFVLKRKHGIHMEGIRFEAGLLEIGKIFSAGNDCNVITPQWSIKREIKFNLISRFQIALIQAPILGKNRFIIEEISVLCGTSILYYLYNTKYRKGINDFCVLKDNKPYWFKNLWGKNYTDHFIEQLDSIGQLLSTFGYNFNSCCTLQFRSKPVDITTAGMLTGIVGTAIASAVKVSREEKLKDSVEKWKFLDDDFGKKLTEIVKKYKWNIRAWR
jgi:hypothetical protein